ncbi:MAG: heme-binding protein [Tepidisphaera sp.]|nr:heme-binding protein [Tepidisphaera sp.]
MKRSELSLLSTLFAGGLAVAVVYGARAERGEQPPEPAANVVSDTTTHHGVATKHTLTLEGANLVIAAAVAKATERHAGAAIAVVDDGGHLIALQRLDGTFAAGSEVSTGKARTAAVFKKPTKVFEDSINGGRFALGSVREMTPLQGGIPIMHDGFVIGGIGVSGAHSQVEDEEIAIAGAAAILGDVETSGK